MTDSKHAFDGSHYEELARHVRSLGDAERAAASAANANANANASPTVTEWLEGAAQVDLLPRSTGFVPLVMDDDDRALHKSLLAISRARMELDARQLDLLQRAADRELHRKHGYAHMVQYMEEVLGYRPHSAYEFLRVTKAILDLPLSKEALSSRTVHYTKVREISRIATPETEPEWLEAARSRTVRELEKLVSGRKRGDRPTDPKRTEAEPSTICFKVTPAMRARIHQARVELDAEYGERMTDEQLFDVFTRRALEAPAHAANHSDGSGRPAYQTAISSCRDCKRSWTNGDGRDHAVDPATLAMAQCDAEHLGDVEAPPERVTTTVTPRKRRQVFARDNHRCVVPGCRATRNLDIHHLIFQMLGCGHDMSNMTTACSAHHHLIHLGLLEITGTAPDGLVFKRTCETEPASEDEVDPIEGSDAEVQALLAAHRADIAVCDTREHEADEVDEADEADEVDENEADEADEAVEANEAVEAEAAEADEADEAEIEGCRMESMRSHMGPGEIACSPVPLRTDDTPQVPPGPRARPARSET